MLYLTSSKCENRRSGWSSGICILQILTSNLGWETVILNYVFVRLLSPFSQITYSCTNYANTDLFKNLYNSAFNNHPITDSKNKI
jgi:hypothetical protein